jgi:class 3 adenylate cyclase
MPDQNRQLAAILFTDIVGSTSMMQKDEQAALSVNKHYVTVT